MELGQRIISKLESDGIKVPILAALLDVPAGRIYKWQKGHKPHDPEDFIKLTNWLESVPHGNKENGTRQDQASKKPVTFNSNTTDPAMKIASQLNQKHETLEQAIASIRIIADTYYQESQNHREALAIIKQLLPNRS